MTPTEMRQQAPYPDLLAELVGAVRYKAGWRFSLVDIDRGQNSYGLTLIINITGPNSYHPTNTISVNHYMIVPPAAYDLRSWRRWLFDQILLVERHEAMEWFQFAYEGDFLATDGAHSDEYVERPYAPSHGPGNDPYLIREVGTEEDQRTSFRGDLKTFEPADEPIPQCTQTRGTHGRCVLAADHPTHPLYTFGDVQVNGHVFVSTEDS